MTDSEREYDVIVAGGGPSGSACTIFLSKMGHKVLLVDKAKFPRDKPCGDGITGKSKSILEELNLVSQVEINPHAIYQGALIFYNSQKLDVSFGSFYGHVSRRIVFDNILFQEAKKFAADAIEGFTITGVVFENGKVVGIKGTRTGEKEEKIFRAKVVVGADGANSVVARETGLAKFQPNHHASAIRVYYKNIKGLVNKLEVYFFDNIMPGYFWIFPLENGMANVGVGMSTDVIQKRKTNLQELMLNEIETNPLLAERFKDAQMVAGSLRGWNLPLATAKRKMYGNGFVLLGDAASLIDPFTGEGIGNGLVSAKTASKVINDAIMKGDYSEKVLSEYQKEMWKIISEYIKYSSLMQIAGKFKWLFTRAFKKFVNNKHFQDMVTVAFNDSSKRKKFSFWTTVKLLIKLIF